MVTTTQATEVFETFKNAEEMLAFLTQKGYKFTTELPVRTELNAPEAGAKILNAMVVDTESTGLDVVKDKIVELGAILVEYNTKTGALYRILDTISELEDPGMPISPDATKTNGITDEMVAGKKIDDAKVEAMIAKAAIVVCHNTGFDRKMLEKRWPSFTTKPFACSLKQIKWADEGITSSKLDYILYKLGFHFNAHRAIVDCYALLEALNADLPVSGEKAMLAMTREARLKDIEVSALNSHFDSKDVLKGNKYFWDGDKKVWHKAVKENDLHDEVEWLKASVYGGREFKVSLVEVDAYTRFSSRNNEETIVSSSEL